MRLKPLLLTAAGSLFLLAGGTAAAAQIGGGPVDSSGVIHGCYITHAVKGSHRFRLQNAHRSCPKGTTAISWNRTGPAGPAGAAGPAGPPGSSTAGSSGLDVITLSTTVAGSGSLTCPSDHPYLISGFSDDDTAAAPDVYIPVTPTPSPGAPARTDGVFAQTAPGSSQGDVLAIWAICAK